MLICGAGNTYPQWQRGAQGFENNEYRWSRHHQHIYSHIFMTNDGIDGFRKYVEIQKVHYDEYEQDKAKWNFQAAVRELHINEYPKVKVDSLVKIWSRVDEWMFDP